MSILPLHASASLAGLLVGCALGQSESPQPFPVSDSAVPDALDTPVDGPPELGRVRFGRDLAAALAASRADGRPVFVLFQEIPGCSTCRDFGAGPLSQPRLVEAIETLFHPVVVRNNAGGEDARILQAYREPSWNNPVARFFDAAGADQIPRRDRVWSTSAIAERLAEALVAARRDVPPWLELVPLETARQTQSVTLAMHCFWEGEARLGALPGVVDGEAGFQDGREVVRVEFDPTRTERAELLAGARERSCADAVFVERSDDATRARANELGIPVRERQEPGRAAGADDHRRRLRRSALGWLPLGRTQATRIESALAAGEDGQRWLSPRQLALLGQVRRAIAADASALNVLPRPNEPRDLALAEERLAASLDALLARGEFE